MKSAAYAFRVLVGPWGSLAIIGLEIANLLQRGRPWRGEALWTADWLAISLFLAGPLLSGLAAVDASRLTRKGTVPIASAMARRHGAYRFAIVWTAGPASAVHVAAFGAALIVGGTAAPPAGWGVIVLTFAVQVLAILAYVALGSAIGRLAAPLAAGIVATVAALAGFYSLSFGQGFMLLDIGGATVSRLGLTLSAPYLLTQLGVLASVASLLSIIPIRSYERRFEVNWLGMGLVTGVIVLLVGSSILGPEERTLVSGPIEPTVCHFVGPTMCFYPEHERVAQQTVD